MMVLRHWWVKKFIPTCTLRFLHKHIQWLENVTPTITCLKNRHSKSLLFVSCGDRGDPFGAKLCVDVCSTWQSCLEYAHYVDKTLTYLLTYLWSWALLEKLSIVQPLKNFAALYGTQRFIPCSQDPSTSLYPEPDWFSPYHPILLSKIHFNIVHPPMLTDTNINCILSLSEAV
jgi:hypothetical protein